MADKTTITIVCTEQEKNDIAKRRDIRGFKSDNEYVKHLLVLGTLVERAITAEHFSSDMFATAFFTHASKLLDAGARAILAAEAKEGFKEWQDLGPETNRVITGQFSKAIK